MLADPVGNARPNTAERSTFPRDWADLPLQRRRDIGKTRILGTANICKVRRRVHKKFKTVRNSSTQTCICAVHKSIAVAHAEIDAVLDLQTARRYNKAGIRDVRSIGRDRVLGAWTTVRPCGDCAETNRQGQQDYCELASERKRGPYNNTTRFPPSHSISRSLTKIARWYLARR
jgi:hypothetical protein